MKILLVEDDEDKRDDLASFIKRNISTDLTIVRSFQSGRKALLENKFDLILLDMTLPTFDVSPTEVGGRSQPFGGRMLLSEILRHRIEVKVIVVSMFDLFGKGDEEMSLTDLDRQLSKQFPQSYLGAIAYSMGDTGWQEILINRIKNIR